MNQHAAGIIGLRQRWLLVLTLMLAIAGNSNAQSVQAIEDALNEGKTARADSLLQTMISHFYTSRQPDSLNNLIFYKGKTEQLKSGTSEAVSKIEAFIRKIKTLSPSPATLRQSYIEAGEYYGFAGKNKLGYQANQEAYRYTEMAGSKPGEMGLIQSNMGVYAQRMGDLSLSQTHHRQALKWYLSDKTINYESLYITYNSMGGIMWYISKLDSAVYYFDQAITTLSKTANNPLNQYYRVAIVQNNVSAIYGMQGKTTEAIRSMKDCLANLKKYLASTGGGSKKSSAVSLEFEATDNLAGIYKELGDYRQAHELLSYSYRQKQQQLNADNPAIFISQILLGQLYYAMKDYDKAVRYLQDGLERISNADGDYLIWQADAASTLALLNEEKKDKELAIHYYEKADRLYEASSGGEYDNIYLEFLQHAAVFYAENKMTRQAIDKALKGYNYIKATQGEETLSGFYQMLNFSEVYFAAGNFQASLNYSQKGLNTVNRIIQTSSNLLDSIKIELKKPKLILLKAKAEYELTSKKNTTSLITLLHQLKEALLILEKRKSIIQDPEDIGLLMADHASLLEFIKKITLDLYQITGKEVYANELVSLHESGLYNRIRSRLDKSGASMFAGVPASVIEKGQSLQTSISNSLQEDGGQPGQMQQYLKLSGEWNHYLDQLRKNYPHYYKMRYASIFKPIKEIQEQFPEGVTIIRYFFTGGRLSALVADKHYKKLILLPETFSEEDIRSLLASHSIKTTSLLLQKLYQQLWAPLATAIKHSKIIIIPDGILHNLNFELLTPQPISSFGELATRSLLSNYTISYQYSLFLTGQSNQSTGKFKNFIAFAPGFTDQIKNQYIASRKELPQQDQGYLNLLPQPFTLSLADKAKNLLEGEAFMHDKSTIQEFRSHAGHHKIIHIGTHAESDNLHPEYSRLIFAKNTSAKEETNSLYLYDIYNCDLRSNLAVLTACESGRPGYQDGEGMLSLAHAFNYAGSESIITGLWKIDEQASALLMELFYKYLLEGQPKDEALRQAKLDYLSAHKGRLLEPNYWAGLILIGDNSPVTIKTPFFKPWMAIVALLIIVGLLTFLLRGWFFPNNSKAPKV